MSDVNQGLPDSYDVTIEVQPAGEPALSMTVKLPGLKRADVMSDDYPAKGIQAVVKQFELMVDWGSKARTNRRATKTP